VLSLNEAALLPHQPAHICSTGIPFLFIRLRTPEAPRSCRA
jgi:predicted PhzF superfamily epimerase YddE/YHI9